MQNPAACLRSYGLAFWLVLAVQLALAQAAWQPRANYATVGRSGLGRQLLQQESGVLTLTELLQQNCTARFCPCRNSFNFARNGDALQLTSVTGAGLACTTAEQLALTQLPGKERFNEQAVVAGQAAVCSDGCLGARCADENGQPSGGFGNTAANVQATGRSIALTPDIQGAYKANTFQFGDGSLTNEYDGCNAIYTVNLLARDSLVGITLVAQHLKLLVLSNLLALTQVLSKGSQMRKAVMLRRSQLELCLESQRQHAPR